MTQNKSLIKYLAGFIGILVLLFFCSTRVAPTDIGYKISNSGDYRGIDSLPTAKGWVFYMPGASSIIKLDGTMQHVVWSKDKTEGSDENQQVTIACKGGAGFDIDVSINYRINPIRGDKVYLKYKTTDLEKISGTYLRSIVRGSMQDVSGIISVDSILNNLPRYEHTVQDTIAKRFAREGFLLDNFNILKQPDCTDHAIEQSIKNKLLAKANAETTQTELAKSTAEAKKKIATAKGDSASRVIAAAGEAEAVKKIQTVLTPTYVDYIKWQNAGHEVPRVPSVVTGGGTLLNLK